MNILKPCEKSHKVKLSTISNQLYFRELVTRRNTNIYSIFIASIFSFLILTSESLILSFHIVFMF